MTDVWADGTVEAPAKIHALILTPYTMVDVGIGTARQSLYSTLFPAETITHVADTQNPGIPTVDLMLVRVDIDGPTLAALKSDDRFFVLEPGPGYNGNALKNWLSGKGAPGDVVGTQDPDTVALAKVTAYLKAL